jgi:hypothetical protein
MTEPSPLPAPSGRPALTITPITVTPTVAPIWRENCVSAVAAPMRVRATAFCTESTNTCIIEPIPIPAMAMLRAASRLVVFTSMRQSRIIPSVSTSGPSTAFHR